MATSAFAHLPRRYFDGLSPEDASQLEGLVAAAAEASWIEAEDMALARHKAEHGRKDMFTPEEAAAYALFKRVHGIWTFERLSGAMTALNEGNFESQALDRENWMLVQFYAHWCGPCHQAAPALNAVALGGARVGKLDCELVPAIAKRFAIRSFPTFVLFRKGSLRAVYRGERTAEIISAWLDEQLS